MSQDEINNEVQIRLAVHDEKFNSLMTKVDSLANEMQDFKNEMRDRDNRRADEIVELRNSIDAKIAEIRNSVEGMGKHIRGLTYTSIAAIAAMVITVLLNLPK